MAHSWRFFSVVDAVNFGVDLQSVMAVRNAGVPEDRRIVFRIGINLGDVIVDGDDVFGDGVNIAARLEGLADPGSVLVSRTVVNHVAGKVPWHFEDLGTRDLKNIPKPVRVFRVEPEAASPDGGAPRQCVEEAREYCSWLPSQYSSSL